MATMVAEFQRICETCRNPFITAVRYPSSRPRRTCSRSCAARLPRRHQPLSERFWRYVTRTPTCWLWTGLHTPNGAGVLPVREQGRVRRMTAAQVAWELHVGPIPAGRRVWRRCRRPACVRPDHLLLVRRGEKVTVDVPVTAVGEVTSDGLLDQTLISVSVQAEATSIPSAIEVDVAGMEVGTAVHARDLKLPSGVTLEEEPDILVLHVIPAPTAEQIEAELGEAAPAAAEAEGEAPAPVPEAAESEAAPPTE